MAWAPDGPASPATGPRLRTRYISVHLDPCQSSPGLANGRERGRSRYGGQGEGGQLLRLGCDDLGEGGGEREDGLLQEPPMFAGGKGSGRGWRTARPRNQAWRRRRRPPPSSSPASRSQSSSRKRSERSQGHSFHPALCLWEGERRADLVVAHESKYVLLRVGHLQVRQAGVYDAAPVQRPSINE